jgi:hypothetical protein
MVPRLCPICLAGIDILRLHRGGKITERIYMLDPRYTEAISTKERVLQNIIGVPLAGKLRIEGFKFDTDGATDDMHTTPIRCTIYSSVITGDVDGDNSNLAFIEAEGFRIIPERLDGLGLMDGTVRFIIKPSSAISE